MASAIPLSYLPQPLLVRAEQGVQYVFAASHASLPLYFALKGKHGYVLENAECFIKALRGLVEDVAKGYDLVAYPESRFPFLAELVKNLPATIQLDKRSKAQVIERALAQAGWSKLERQSQERSWREMGETFTINKVKANQRKRYVPHLFEPVAVGNQRVLFLDDFVMSGNTLAAARASMGLAQCDCFGVFYQAAPGSHAIS